MKRTFVLLLTGVAWLTLLPAQEGKSESCEAPPEVRIALDILGPPAAEWEVDTWKFGKLAGIVRNLQPKLPGNFWVERVRIDASRGANGVSSDALIAEFQRRHEAKPKDPEAAYLYAYSLIHKDSHRAIELMTPLTADAEPFPPALMTLAKIYDFGGVWEWVHDEDKMKSLSGIYLQRCAGSLESEALSIARRLDSSDVLKVYVAALRNRIAGKAEPELLTYYGTLWTLEGQVTPPQEAATVRARIAADIEFLKGLDQQRFPGAAGTLAIGAARLAGNTVFRDGNMINVVLNDWQITNPKPKGEAGHQAVQDWQRKRLAVIEGWRATHPGNPAGQFPRWDALASLDDTPLESLLREGQRLLEGNGNYGNDKYVVAKGWAAQGVALDRIPPLIERDIEENKIDGAQWDSDLYSGSYRAELRKFADSTDWLIDDFDTLASAYEKSGKLDEARGVLSRWKMLLVELRQRADEARRRTAAVPAGVASPLPLVARNLPGRVADEERRYNAAFASLAAAEGRKPDALLYYHAALKGKPLDEVDADLVDEVSTLWQQLGGTREALRTWVATEKLPEAEPSFSQSASTNWIATERPMIDFSLPDRNGRKWTLADFKGKTTLVTVWATWCPPCREELPQVQTLYEKLAGRKDIQLVTLNADIDKSLVDPYMNNQKYSFPAVYAEEFLHGMNGFLTQSRETGIPQSWIIDKDGVIRSKLLDYDGSGDKWQREALIALDNAH